MKVYENIQKSLFKLTNITAFIIIAGILLLNFKYSSITYSSWYPLIFTNNFLIVFIQIVFAIIIINLFYILSIKLPKRWLITLIVVINLIAFIFKLLVSINFSSIPIDDSYIVFEAANAYVYNHLYIPEYISTYLMHIPRQLGLVTILLPLVKIFNFNYFYLINFQAILIQVSILVIGIAIYKLKGIKSFFISTLLLNLFIPTSFLTLLVYGEVYTLFFLSLAFLFYVYKSEKNWFIWISILSLGFAYLSRTTTNIWIIALIITIIFTEIPNRKILTTITCLLLILIVPYNLVSYIYSTGVVNVNDHNYPQNTWIRLGLGYSGFDGVSAGYYNDQVDKDFILLNEDTDDMELLNQKIINDSIDYLLENNNFIKFFAQKMIISWTDADFDMLSRIYPFAGEYIGNPYGEYLSDNIYGSASINANFTSSFSLSIFDNRTLIMYLEKIYMYQILILLMMSFLLIKHEEKPKIFISILIIGVFLFNLIFEVKGRYNFIHFTGFIVFISYYLIDTISVLKDKLKSIY